MFITLLNANVHVIILSQTILLQDRVELKKSRTINEAGTIKP